MKYPDELKYTHDHEWLQIEGNVGTVGITDFAQRELTDIVYIELPSIGDVIKQGKPFGSVEAIKAVSDLYCPVDGTVIEINEELVEYPHLVNDDPYGSGWMIKIELSDPAQVDELLSADQYDEIVD